MNSLLRSMRDVAAFQVDKDRLRSATHEEILEGATSDVYFQKTFDILRLAGREDTEVVAEVFGRGDGILAGMAEVRTLLKDRPVQLWGLPDGSEIHTKDVVLRLQGKYSAFGIFETALLGILAASSGWATAAKACKEAAGSRPVISFGARHVHPAIASVMDAAAVLGGADGCSSVLGARLLGIEASGTVPHAAALIIGDTLEVAKLQLQTAAPGGRTVLIDTFQDETVEALRVGEALGKALEGIRLDTPSERGGVTTELVREMRARLDQAGLGHVRIFVSGGLSPDRIRDLSAAGADAFGVGHYIAVAPPLEMTMDIKEVAGRPLAKRGRIPGITPSSGLRQIQ